MTIPKLSIDRAQLARWLPFGGVAAILLASAAAMMLTWPRPSTGLPGFPASVPVSLRNEYTHLVKELRAFQDREQTLHSQVVSADTISRELEQIQNDVGNGHIIAGRDGIRSLNQSLTNWNLELTGPPAPAAEAAAGAGVRLPILLYHYPPPNFDDQLTYLQQAGYTAIDLDQAVAGLRGGPLPAKPVVITFDDGFAAQMTAFDSLRRHSMKATFYIIDGGEASQWCIGAGRRYGDPLQPQGGCGDAYLTWDQVRMLDRSGLITIGGHTINHRNLATLSEADQRFEIQTGKEQLEEQLGHSIRHFAYPYGAYDATSIQIAREAGYLTAVTTTPGLDQSAGGAFTLNRERDAFDLP